jgi:hypothetical protein
MTFKQALKIKYLKKASLTDDETTLKRKSKRVSFSSNVQLKLFEKALSNDNDKSDNSIMTEYL